MTDPPVPPAGLEPSDSPQAALEGDLATVTDDEFFDALGATPLGREADGTVHDPAADVLDLRRYPPEQAAEIRAEHDQVGR